MNRFHFAIAASGIAILVLVAVLGCQQTMSALTSPGASASSAGAAVTRVTVARPMRKTLRRECVQPGQIEAFEFTPLFAKFPSYVQKLHVDLGDPVKVDQLLVELSIPELKDELLQKEAALIQAHAEIELATSAIQAAEAAVATAKANVSAAEAGNIRAEADVKRWQSQNTRTHELVATGSLERKLEDETQDSLKAAEAALGECKAKVAAAKATVNQTEAELAKAKANQSVARARQGNADADLARVKSLIDYTQIRAPYAGVVTERSVNRGDFVQPANTATAKPLLVVACTDPVRIFVDVPEMDSPLIKNGSVANINIQALPDELIEGKVTRTSWVLNGNRTLRTEVDVANPKGLLRPGMYATAHIVLEERANALTIPSAAIARKGKQAFCWVVNDGHVMRTDIAVGLQVGNDVEVISGLKGDEAVIQSQISGLQEGQPVEATQTK